MRLSVLLTTSAALAAVPYSVIFEAKPRAVAAGRDPVLSVRASGALSLLKVEAGNLWLHTSFDGGDSFPQKARVNHAAGEVSSHHESSPQMSVRTRSELYVLWQKRQPDGEGSSLRFARSLDWGESFTPAMDVDPSQKSPSQGFYTLNVSPKGTVHVAWLDGRERGKGKPGTSAVYIARSENRGVSFEPAVRVSLDSCPCCRPSISFGEGTVHVAWRRVVDDNIRDIFVSTSRDGGRTWQAPVRVAEDNWKLNGCPHSGAGTASLGKRLYVAWATVREGKSQLYLAWSDDGGATFSKRTALAGATLDPNHPYLAAAGESVAAVFQGREPGEKQGWGAVRAYYREIDAAGRLSPLVKLAGAGASAAYPTLAYEEPGRIFVAWTEPGDEQAKVILARGRRVEVKSAR